jgi:hypothetical protein
MEYWVQKAGHQNSEATGKWDTWDYIVYDSSSMKYTENANLQRYKTD